MTSRLTTWWHGRRASTGKTARTGARHLQRLAAQGPDQAQTAGRKLAAKVIAAQEMACLHGGRAHLLQRDPVRLMQRSALSVISRPVVRASDAAWRATGRSRRPACPASSRPRPSRSTTHGTDEEYRPAHRGKPREYVAELWVSQQLRDRIQRAGISLADALELGHARQPQPTVGREEPNADREPEP